MISLLDVQRGYDAWAAKPHNAKWVRKIDGTPIANDIVVNIFNTLHEISAALSVEAVAVKPLEWEKAKGRKWQSGTAFGIRYLIEQDEDFFSLSIEGTNLYGNIYLSLSEAKAAAQADYSARILSALHPAPAPAVEGWRPIDSAPRDADILLAIVRDEDGEAWEHVTQGRWIDGVDDQVDQPGHDAGFVDCDYLVFFPGRSFGYEKSRYIGTQPTHWMPLPAAPAAPTPQTEEGE